MSLSFCQKLMIFSTDLSLFYNEQVVTSYLFHQSYEKPFLVLRIILCLQQKHFTASKKAEGCLISRLLFSVFNVILYNIARSEEALSLVSDFDG